MKTTISTLRNRITILETNMNSLYHLASDSMCTSKIRELNGNETVIASPERKFEDVIAEIENSQNELARLKAIVARLNASTKLSNGQSISEAIYTLNCLRRTRSTLYGAVIMTPRINRRSDSGMNGSAYYDVSELNYDKAEVTAKYNAVTEQIAAMESEIDKLNSIEIEVEDM